MREDAELDALDLFDRAFFGELSELSRSFLGALTGELVTLIVAAGLSSFSSRGHKNLLRISSGKGGAGYRKCEKPSIAAS